MPKVIIDGIEYIPAKNAIPSYMSIAKALLSYYYGECGDDKVNELMKDDFIYISVNDSGEGAQLKDVLDTISRFACD